MRRWRQGLLCTISPADADTGVVMEEKKSYSVDEIINETRKLHTKSHRDISHEAELKAEEILRAIRPVSLKATAQTEAEQSADYPKSVHQQADIMRQRSQHMALSADEEYIPAHAAKSRHSENETENFEKAPRQQGGESISYEHLKPSAVHDTPAKPQQKKKRHRSIDETVAAAGGSNYASRIDYIVSADMFDEDREKKNKEKELTRTGVIRKADRLINEDSDGIITRAPAAEKLGGLTKDEKIVGEKEDVQTKVYNEYIRRKEKKKQDTGIIKNIGIKVAEHMPEIPKPVLDRETDTEKTLVRNTDKKVLTDISHTGNIEGQTRLEGFESNEVEKISEDELEAQLDKNRRKKIEEFSFADDFKDKNEPVREAEQSDSIDDTYAPKKETPVIDEIVDYNSKNDKRAIYLELRNMYAKFRIRTLLTGLLEIAAAVVGLLGSGIISDFGLGTGNEKVYIIINIAILLLMCILSAKAIIKGIAALFTLKPSGDSLMSLAAIVTLAHCILAITLGESGAGASHIYVAAAGFILLLNSIGKELMMRRVQKNFRLIIGNTDKYTVARITDEREAEELARGTDLPYYDIRYNVKTEFATKFLANSYAADPADDMAKKTAYIALAASVVLAAAVYFISRDIVGAASVLTGALLITAPAANIISFNSALEGANSELLKERGAICGFDAVNDACKTNAVVLDAGELFPAKNCAFKGIKIFSHMKIDDALVYTASVLRETTHPFRDVFMESVGAETEHLPKASDTVYEAKLGISSWIYDRKILLGNEEMMGAHGIAIPYRARPKDYISENGRVMFLAIDGVISAMFIVEYSADPVIQYELQRLEASCIEVLVRSVDSNIDEDMLDYLFGLSGNSIRVISVVANSIYDEKTVKPLRNEAKLINKGDPVTFMRSITACPILGSQFRLLKIIQYIAMAIGFAVIAVFGLMNTISAIGALHIVIYALIWTAITTIVPRIYKAVPKR